MTELGLGLALVVGVSLGLLGGGGSTLAVPILVYVAGFEAKPAIAMSLAIVGSTALLGAILHSRHGRVDWAIAAMFAPLAMVGSYLGARRLSVLFSGSEQLIMFALVMLVGAGFMLRIRRNEGDAEKKKRVGFSFWRMAAIGAEGLFVGILNGLLGVGGGFMIVPALVLLAGLPMKHAVGTSLLIIALNSATGFVAYLDLVRIDWLFLGLFTGIAALGILVGTRLMQSFSQAGLRRAFAVFLLLMAVWILVHNRGTLLGERSFTYSTQGRPNAV